MEESSVKTTNNAECKHENFETSAKVTRLVDQNKPIEWRLALRVRCADCKKEFRFFGLPIGYHLKLPTLSVDGKELRAPIEEAKIILMKGVH